ncbi:DUF3710 domain-containing protein [Nonomuraea sp. NPDC050663]|uniref:DUF3710 domain-containing protein n=1 Tax=Nonomuraea sp. NPDC050663 TaxID=3364370 RepID=UPI0037884306
MFRRRRREQTQEASAEVAEMRASGPWDSDEPHPATERIDLGGLRVPPSGDFELRLAVMGDQLVGVIAVQGDSSLQLQALAAPKSGGLWEEVKTKIAGQLTSAEHRDGPFGTEIAGQVQAEGQTRATRHIGVEGPRWLLMAVVSGPAATDESLAEPFEAYLRDVVVVRGQEPMAKEETIPLRRPNERAAQAEEDEPGLDPFRRGPEISEIR